jgi:hypothetical protein
MSLVNSLFESINTIAYIGPGADLGLISSVIGLLLTLGASGLFIVLWPIRTLWRKIRGYEDSTMDGAPSEPESV